MQPFTVVIAEVEVRQHSEPLGMPIGDLIQDVFHLSGEGVIHQSWEVLLQQSGDSKGQPGRHQRGTLFEHIVPGSDSADDRRVGRRPADLQLFQLGDEGRLGIASRWPRLMARRRHRFRAQRLPSRQTREPGLLVIGVAVGFLDRFHVCLEESIEGDRAARCHKGARLAVATFGVDLDGDRKAFRVLHLGRDSAHPDQLIKPELITG